MTVNLAPKLTWNLSEAASATGIGESTLRRAAALGRLKVNRIGRRVVIPDECLRDYVSGKDWKRQEPQQTSV
jgi:excisionase family DNA binding protein